MKSNKSEDKAMLSSDDLSSQRFYHGTKTDLKPGDLIGPGYNSNYGKRKKASYVIWQPPWMRLPGAPNLPLVKDPAEFI